jgi:putative lipoic acid-binding regulatory protein
MTEAESLIAFPCRFPVKAMGRNEDGFESVVTRIIKSHAELHERAAITTSASAEGNFLSVTVTILAESREQLDKIYRDLAACEQVLMAL